jgi:FkbM family methyltransferase
MQHNNLIFDLGFHKGEDTTYYLSLGYDVIAVEANSYLCEIAQRQFKEEMASGRLILYNRALSNLSDEKIEFYINQERTEVSSLYQEIAEQDNTESIKVEVDSITLYQLIAEHGTPYYIKCDVEGMDSEVARQLRDIKPPKCISFELNKMEYDGIFTYLKLSGYKKFKLINQIRNKQHCSGNFGELLDGEWLSYSEALNRYMKYRELKIIDNINLGVGWMDIHACL